MLTICFIVEGLTEERFIQEALLPYLENKLQVKIYATIENLSGGILYKQLHKFIENNLKAYCVVTTLIDLVGLKDAKIKDYQGIMNKVETSQKKAINIENNLLAVLNLQNIFIPYVQPYEFEALCFADFQGLVDSDPKLAKNKVALNKILQEHNNDAESINSTPATYPAKRLEKFGYVKKSSLFAKHCSIDNIRKNAPHFNEWLGKLETKITQLKLDLEI